VFFITCLLFSGVDIDHPRDNCQKDVHRSSGSDQSTRSSVNVHPNGAIGWSTNERPAKDSDLHNDKTVNPQLDGSQGYKHDYEELPMKYVSYNII